MKYAVITPYYIESTEKLWRCHASVKAQSIPADHIMVADGHPNPAIDGWPATHIRLPIRQNDAGYTPRMIGLLTASALDYDGYLLLDADNWFEPNHVAQMALAQRRTGAEIVTCPRNLRRLDGSLMAVCTESDGVHFNDFNCYLFTREALAQLRPLCFADRRKAYFTDRALWTHLRAGKARIARASLPTVNYETTILAHYVAAGETPPPQAKDVIFFTDTNSTKSLTVEDNARFRQDPRYRLAPLTYNDPDLGSGR